MFWNFNVGIVYIIYVHGSNPAILDMHVYDFGSGYGGYTITPFAYSDWGGTPATGNGMAVVITNLGDYGYSTFNIQR